MGSRYYCPGNYLSTERPTNNYNYEIAKVVDVSYGKRAYSGSGGSYYPIFGSIDAVKRFLPSFLSDSTAHITRLKDTTIINQGIHYHINCVLMNRGIQPGGKLYDVSYAEDHHVSSFSLFINKKSLLPTIIEHKSAYMNETKSWWKATSLMYNFKPLKPDSVWNLTSNPLNYIAYSSEELRENRKERLRTLLINTEAPGWELPDLSGTIHTLDEFSDKLLLLEFWYNGCGGCHRSIPFLNQVKKQFDPARFDVVGVNFVYTTDKAQLQKYVKESGMDFLVLDMGALTAIDYKVNAGPTIMLIKNSKIVHAVEGYNDEVKAELTEMIEKYI